MSSEVPIPEAAFEAAAMPLAQYMAQSDTYDAASDALRAAAPLIVAAELERLADELPGEWKRWSADYQAGRYDARQFFLNRAADLRGASVLRGEGQTDG